MNVGTAPSSDFETHFADLPIPCWLYQVSTLRIVAVNAKAISTYGYSRQEFLSKLITDIRPQEDRLKVEALAKQISTAVRFGPWRHVTASGEIRQVMVTQKPFGRDTKLVLVEDITGALRSGAEAARMRQDIAGLLEHLPQESANTLRMLVESQNRFSTAFHNSPVGQAIATIDEGRFIDVNDAGAAILGRGYDELIGRSSLELGIWTDPTERARALDDFRNRKLKNRLVDFNRPDGSVRHVRFSASEVLLDQRPFMLSVFLDVTEDLQSEQRMREREAMLAATQRIAKVGSWEFLSVKGAFGAGACSEETRRILNLPNELTFTFDVFVKAFSNNEQELVEKLLYAVKSGIAPDLEAHTKPNPVARIVRLSATHAVIDEHRSKVLGSIQDVTVSRFNEDLARQTQKLDAIGRLADGIAHDFNNVLNVISGYAELLRNMPNASERSNKYADKIMAASLRAQQLTTKLSGFTRKQELKTVYMQVNDAIADIAKGLTGLIGESIQVSLELGDKLPEIYIDAVQFEQVILNLVFNARDAMPNGGKLNIRTYCVPSGSVQAYSLPLAEQVVAVAVSDEGCGMEDQVATKVFEPFFTTKERGKGAGLGLASVYSIVTQNGGRIELNTAVGQGSTFTILMPGYVNDRAGAVASGPEAASSVRGEGEIVVLVEDEQQLREAITEYLEGIGYVVHAARDATEAENLLCDGSLAIDLMIADIDAPQKNGLALCSLATIRHPRLKTLLLSAHEQGYQIADKDGPDRVCLKKPFTMQHLSETVRQVLRRPTEA